MELASVLAAKSRHGQPCTPLVKAPPKYDMTLADIVTRSPPAFLAERQYGSVVGDNQIGNVVVGVTALLENRNHIRRRGGRFRTDGIWQEKCRDYKYGDCLPAADM